MKRRLTVEQQAFREEVREFTAGLQPEPRHADLSAKFHYLTEFQLALDAAGLAVPTWPKRFGGRELDAVAAAIVSDELGRAHAPEIINFVATDIVAPALMKFSSEECLDRWLPRMAPAEEVWCQLFSEPNAGSDLASLRTRAVPTSEGWRVTGEKVWSTWAQFATSGLLLARTTTTASPHRGITAFVVDMNAPGVTVSPLTTMTGEAEFASVHLEDVLVRSGDVVGEVDGGWSVAMYMLAHERGPYAVRRASVLRGALGRVIAEAQRQPPQSSRSRGEIVDAFIAMELLDLQIDRVVEQIDAGEVGGADAPITKRLLAMADQSIFRAALSSVGASGMAWDGDGPGERVAAEYLYSLAASIYGGTQQIQQNLIAERLLGLPREPVHQTTAHTHKNDSRLT